MIVHTGDMRKRKIYYFFFFVSYVPQSTDARYILLELDANGLDANVLNSKKYRY